MMWDAQFIKLFVWLFVYFRAVKKNVFISEIYLSVLSLAEGIFFIYIMCLCEDCFKFTYFKYIFCCSVTVLAY